MGFNRNIKGFNLSAVVPKWSISEPISLLPPMDVLQGGGSFGRFFPTLKCGTFGPYMSHCQMLGKFDYGLPAKI